MLNKDIFMRPGFLKADLWNGLYGLFQKKIFKVNFVDVKSAYQTWVKRHYIAILLERNIKQSLLKYYYYLVYFLIHNVYWYFLVYFGYKKFDDMVCFVFHSELW